MNKRYAFWFVVAVLAVMPIAAIFGALTVTRAAMGTTERWVYEDCISYADRLDKCVELDEPRLEETTPGGADI